MLQCIDDSEDELCSGSPAQKLGVISPDVDSSLESDRLDAKPAASTAMQLQAARHDVFDVESTFMMDGANEPKTYSTKRRKTVDGLSVSPNKRLKQSKSQRSQTGGDRDGSTQRAREDVLMPDFADTNDTIKIATGERQELLEGAAADSIAVKTRARQAGHQETVGSNGSHESNSSSIPWSADPIHTPSTEKDAEKRRSQSSQSIRDGEKRRTSSSQADAQAMRRTQSSQASVGYGQSSKPSQNNVLAKRSDGLTAEDVEAIGLPKEQYKPRPSRSRSAQVAEIQTDWSVAPEKMVSKTKRRAESALDPSAAKKRVDPKPARGQQKDISGDNTPEVQRELLERARQAREEDSSGDRTASRVSTVDAVAVSTVEPGAEQALYGSVVTHVNGSNSDEGIPDGPTDLLPVGQTTSREEPMSQHLTAPLKEVEVRITPPSTQLFATPGAPASASSASASSKKKTKSRRSHTTIFEDHVGLDERPDASPNLRQQQAQRKRGRPRKTVTATEPDGDDVSAAAEPEVADKPAAKKRGRPRKNPIPDPPAVPEPQVSDAEHVAEASDAAEDRLETQPVPSNRGRKSSARARVVTDEDDEDLFARPADAPTDQTEVPAPEGSDGGDHLAGIKDTQSPNTTRTHADLMTGKENRVTTPPPIQRSADSNGTSAGKQTHSPIKKGLASFRVGLSKRQRIQPLLRMLKR